MTDYNKLVRDAREYSDALAGGEDRNWIRLVELANRLADAVEAAMAKGRV
jgi:hypothetical protein